MKRILRIDSAFSNFANKLDDNDNVVIKHKGEADELVTIADMILSIYSTESVKYFGIDKACIWNIDEQKIEKEFKNLPDTNLKKTRKLYRIANLESQIKKLKEELQREKEAEN